MRFAKCALCVSARSRVDDGSVQLASDLKEIPKITPLLPTGLGAWHVGFCRVFGAGGLFM